jgi:molybdate transport system substrate-binding protein
MYDFSRRQAGEAPPHSLSTRLTAFGLGVVLISIALFSAASARAGEVLVFAAASQRNALDAVIAAYEKTGKDKVKAAYQSSSTLARQIEQGAPADIFISANPKWMTYLEDNKLIDGATRIGMFGNGLVLVTARSSKADEVDLAKGFDLAGLIGDGKLAVGDPDHVPAGIYAKQAMQALGLWESMQTKLARADNVRSALALVSRGEAPYGIVYSSDAVADKGVKVVGAFPEDSHPKIVYPVAVTADAKNPAGAKALLAFLRTPEAVKIYESYGFRVLASATN